MSSRMTQVVGLKKMRESIKMMGDLSPIKDDTMFSIKDASIEFLLGHQVPRESTHRLKSMKDR